MKRRIKSQTSTYESLNTEEANKKVLREAVNSDKKSGSSNRGPKTTTGGLLSAKSSRITKGRKSK